jgi:hypothetical protein
MKNRTVMMLAACAAITVAANAQEEGSFGVTPIMLSFFTPLELPSGPHLWDVRGLRLSLPYGRCESFAGLDVGVVTHASEFFGLQFAAVNIVEDDIRMTLSVGGLVNVVGGSYTGVQLGGLVNVVGNDAHGLSVAGLVNYTGGSLSGVQVGFVNIVPDQAKDSWQFGFWNHGGALNHCGQVGIFNYARDMDCGVQFGLINIIEHNEFPCIPFMNCHF